MKVRRDINGIHLFDRRSGLNVLFDEAVVPLDEWHSAPRFVSIALTNACDLHCSFCYAPKTPSHLDANTVIEWAVELSRHGCLGIGFGGGEPTIHPQFSYICRSVATHTDLAVTFTTHAHHVNESLVEELTGGVHFVRVSMDGVGETYYGIRGRRFSGLVDKLALIRRLAPFGVNCVVNSLTIKDLDQVAETAFEHGASELLLLPERPVAGRGGIDKRTKCVLEDWIGKNRTYRLAISAGTELEGVPLALPFRDTGELLGYAHIDASGILRRSSFSTDGVRVEGTVGAALRRLSEMTEGGV